MSAAAAVDDVDNDLSRLYDSLNLTGRVIRLGNHIGAGGCADVYEARLASSPSRRPSSNGATHLTSSTAPFSVIQLANPSNGNGTSSLASRYCAAVPSLDGLGHISGMHEEGQRVAVKVVRENASSAGIANLGKRLVREVRAWSKLYHRNVLPLLGFTYGFDPNSRLASLVSPWMPYGTAGCYLEKRSAEERIRILTGIADGLCYLHRHDVVHGDLKGDNVMIDSHFEPRISDFGLSKLLDEANTNTLTQNIGSVRWTARELIMDQHCVTVESDIWAFGMTALELFTNAPPYAHLRKDAQIIVSIYKGELPARPTASPITTSAFGRLGMGMKIKRGVPMDDNLWDICKKCWVADPRLRPSTRELSKQLWELDLKCKLRTRKRTRRARSPEAANSELRSSSPVSDRTSVDSGVKEIERGNSPEERLRKSPKLAHLQEITAENQPPPSPGALVRMRPRTRATSGSGPVSTVSTRPSTPTRSHAAIARHRSRHSSHSNHFVDDVEGHGIFTHNQSDGNLLEHLWHRHHHQQQAERMQRTSSEPMQSDGYSELPPGSGLGLDWGSSNELPSSSSQTLVLSPTRTRCSSGVESPRNAHPYLTHVHEDGYLSPQQFDFDQDRNHPELRQRNYNFGSGVTCVYDHFAQAQAQGHVSHRSMTESRAQPHSPGIYNDVDAQPTAHPSSQWASIPPNDINAPSSSSLPPLHSSLSDGNISEMQIYQTMPIAHSHGYPSYTPYPYAYDNTPHTPHNFQHAFDSSSMTHSYPSDLSRLPRLPSRTTYHTLPGNVVARRLLLEHPNMSSSATYNFNRNTPNLADYSPPLGSAPSPHTLGPVFSESFPFAPVHTSPLTLDEPLPEVYPLYSPYVGSQASRNQAVDFTSMRAEATVSPALSDVSVPTPNLPSLPGPSIRGRTRFPSVSGLDIPQQDLLSNQPPLERRPSYPEVILHPEFSETPVMSTLEDDFDAAFERYDGEEYALFGGYNIVDSPVHDSTPQGRGTSFLTQMPTPRMSPIASTA